MGTATAVQKRELARQDFNAALKDCPGHEVLSMLSDKWATLVIGALVDGSLRRGDMARVVAGASQKMLTQTLRKLEREGLVLRHITLDVPVRVEYELSPLGRSIVPLQQLIMRWAEDHIDAIHRARREYDARAGRAGDR